MPDEILEMPFLRNIGFVMTYKCQVACPHCIIKAGPHRKESTSSSDAFDWIRQIVAYRDGYIKVLSLTGGEPFYDINSLKEMAVFAEDNGLLVSVVTNAFWASTQEEAIRILKELPSIKMLAVSTDEYHQRSIPFDRVKNAILAARKCAMPYNVAVCTENREDKEYKNILEMLKEITEEDSIYTAITFPAGRALEELGYSKYQTSKEPPISACSAGSSPMVFPDGKVIACIGPVIGLQSSHPLLLGSLRENTLQEILDKAELNPVLHAIRIWGPKKLISIIEEAGLGQHLPKEYIGNSVCNACYNLMSSPRIVEFFAQLAEDTEFRQKVAYARLYYLKESEMIERCQSINSKETV